MNIRRIHHALLLPYSETGWRTLRVTSFSDNPKSDIPNCTRSLRQLIRKSNLTFDRAYYTRFIDEGLVVMALHVAPRF